VSVSILQPNTAF